MTERGMMFEGHLVRSMLAGEKTQTRRPVKPQPTLEVGANHVNCEAGDLIFYPTSPDLSKLRVPRGRGAASAGFLDAHPYACPHGVVGDRIWVRETHGFPEVNGNKYRSAIFAECYDAVWYRATDPRASAMKHGPMKSLHWTRRWRPAIHMHRWASRLTLEITDVRLELVVDISEDDAWAEGVRDGGCLSCGRSSHPEPCGCDDPLPSYRETFWHAWMKRYGPEALSDWAWVLTFKVLEADHG